MFSEILTIKLINYFSFKMRNLLEITQEKKVSFWFMRQAGRYLPEYRQIRANFTDFMEMCLHPEIATEITLQPLKRFDMDAAIIFSDILTIPHFLDFKVKFDGGPVVEKITSESDLDKFQEEKIMENFSPIAHLIKNVRQELYAFSSPKSLIGFSGAPWTLFCYMLDGRIDKSFISSRKFIYQKNQFFTQIINKLTDMIICYLTLQIEAGVDTVKIFDSWAGVLSYNEFQLYCMQPIKRIVQTLREKFPYVTIIAFPKGAGNRYQSFVEQVKPDIIATDYGLSTQELQNLQKQTILQSNLDPMLLAFDIEKALQKTREIFNNLKKPFVFNLGHGIHKETPVKNVEKVVDLIKSIKYRLIKN